MNTLITSKSERNFSTMTHLSAFAKYIIPFGNFIVPTIFWASKKNESQLVNHSGKEILNFQLSILLYSAILFIVSVPSLIVGVLNSFSWNEIENANIVLDNLELAQLGGLGIFAFICLALFGIMKIVEFILIIYASVKVNEGEFYKYPFTINFFK